MLNEYLKHLNKPLADSRAVVILLLTKISCDALIQLADMSIKQCSSGNKDFCDCMHRIKKAVETSDQKSVKLFWGDFKTLMHGLEMKLQQAGLEENIQTRFVQQQILDACYETEYKFLWN